MTNEQVKRVLSGLGITEYEDIQTPQFRCIIMTTNQGISYMTDFLTFDFDNSLLKIKEKVPKMVNGKVMRYIASGTTIRSISKQIFAVDGTYGFRAPKAGDIVFAVNKKTGVCDLKNTCKITEVGRTYLILDKEPSFDQNAVEVLYGNENDINAARQDPLYKARFFQYTDATKNKYDKYLNINAIVGFELISNRMGAAGLI